MQASCDADAELSQHSIDSHIMESSGACGHFTLVIDHGQSMNDGFCSLEAAHALAAATASQGQRLAQASLECTYIQIGILVRRHMSMHVSRLYLLCS